MKILNLAVGIIGIIIFFIISSLFFSSILFLAEDTSEQVTGDDMAAVFNLTDGFNWIYPGDSVNAEGQTLHNIHLNNESDPYHAAQDIISYTYGTKPHIIVTITNKAAKDIFGSKVIKNIRHHDWKEGYKRGDAVDSSMKEGGFNYYGVLWSLLNGNIKFYLV